MFKEAPQMGRRTPLGTWRETANAKGSTTKGGRRLAKLDTQGNACSAAAIGIGGTSAIRESGIEQASGLEYQLRLETFVGLFRPLNWPLKHPALSERPSND